LTFYLLIFSTVDEDEDSESEANLQETSHDFVEKIEFSLFEVSDDFCLTDTEIT